MNPRAAFVALALLLLCPPLRAQAPAAPSDEGWRQALERRLDSLAKELEEARKTSAAPAASAVPGVSPGLDVAASLILLKPGSGNLEYGTVVDPLPAAVPAWNGASVSPEFSPGFELSVQKVFADARSDVRLDWAHLDAVDHAGVRAPAGGYVGPDWNLGPNAVPWVSAHATSHFNYNSAALTAGRSFGLGDRLSARLFGGFGFARIAQNLTSAFQSDDLTMSLTQVNNSVFTGAGPRVGAGARYENRGFEATGEAALSELIGGLQSGMVFFSRSQSQPVDGVPTPNIQTVSSPTETRLVPGLEARVGAGYSRPLGRVFLKLEAGYQTLVYFGAINEFGFTTVANPPVTAGDGVYFQTITRRQSNFTLHGPYARASLRF